ncbi:Fc.00g018230.m01.CDS01 [Cosmosporella sp. VM-42]
MPNAEETPVNETPKESTYARSACTECSRRKQKCNREWPCNHCQKRKVADKCRFKDTSLSIAESSMQEKRRKRRLDDDSHTNSTGSEEEVDSDGIDAMGYMPTHVLYGLTARDEIVKASSREYIRDPQTCHQLERALQIIPPRPYTDTLVQNFLNNVNFHYYIVYPPSFLEQYQQWWTDRAANKPLCVQWTCLLLMACACASQYTDVDLQRKLEIDLGDTVQRLTEQYHEAARQLGSTIPIGYSHLVNVQQLLHSCYWFKSEARFVECWHVLNSAIREAQELSMHKESPDDPVPEFELEIRRRIWCVLDTWDWQISALLGRPMIIDRADCNVELPSLVLEEKGHSPLSHMKLQSGLIRQLFGRFGLTKNVVSPRDVQEYQRIIETWINGFPPPFNVHNPDKSLDESCPWIVLHRHYLRTMAFSMLLDPIRAYLARPFTIDATEAELQIRSDGIDYCLELMISLRGFFDHVYPRDAKFHFVLFCIFDTSTVLCSSILHDEHHTLPRRDDVFQAIDDAHAMLQRLNTVTKSAKTSYGILTRIVQRLPRTVVLAKTPEENPAKRPRVTEVSMPQAVSPYGYSPQGIPQNFSPQGIPRAPSPQNLFPQVVSLQHISPPIVTPGSSGAYTEVSTVSIEPLAHDAYAIPDPANYAEWHQVVPDTSDHMVAPIMEQPFQDGNFANISDEDLGDLASLWNYQSLDFGFISPQPPPPDL